MTSRKAAGLFFALPIALCLSLGTAAAQDSGTTVVKQPAATTTPVTTPPSPQGLTEPQDQLRPAVGDETGATGAPAPDDEITPTATDEGAGWEAAVEAAQAATPLIGEAQTKAVERINAYFNNITNLQGSFEQVDCHQQAFHRTLLRAAAGQDQIRLRAAQRAAYRGRRIIRSPSRIPTCETVEKYPIQSTPFRLLLSDSVDLARDARIVGVESQEGTLAISLEDKSGDAAGTIRLVFDSGAELQLKQWLITDAQGLTTRVDVNDIVAGRKVATDFFTSKDGFQPFH